MTSYDSARLLDYDSPLELKEFLDAFGFGMQKKFGQNFLIDRKCRTDLVSMLNLEECHNKVWEVGPGLGAMTSLLLEQNVELIAFEIDRGFIAILKQFFGSKENFKLIEGDVLKNWKTELKNNGKPNIFFGNLPYNIATELILDTIENLIIFDKMLITVQKEVAQKITAKPNDKNYGVLSVLCNWLYDCKIVKKIPRSAFWPQPHIDSATVLFTPKNSETPQNGSDNFSTKLDEEKSKLFIKVVKALFSSRRKTIKNNLSAFLKQNSYGDISSEVLQKASLKENIRAENLSLYDFLALSDIIIKTEKLK